MTLGGFLAGSDLSPNSLERARQTVKMIKIIMFYSHDFNRLPKKLTN